MSDPASKQFTVAQANHAIPSLEASLKRVSATLRDLESQLPGGVDESRRLGLEGGRPVPFRYFRGVEQIELETQSLDDQGIIIRDLQRGLVDFPSTLDGRKVFLCWVKGESRVAYYHDPESGFAGRQPLPPDLDRG